MVWVGYMFDESREVIVSNLDNSPLLGSSLRASEGLIVQTIPEGSNDKGVAVVQHPVWDGGSHIKTDPAQLLSFLGY